jgi:uncharacterized membrane protein
VSKESERPINSYLRELKRELRGLPRHRRRGFVKEVQTRIDHARSSLPSDREPEIRRMLERFGHPADVAAEAHDFAARPIRRSALEDGALMLLSPLVILVALFMSPVLLVAWMVGAIMLCLSRAWTGGEKLIGISLSGVSFVWAGIIGLNLQIRDPNAGTVGLVLAVSLLIFFLLVQMVPAFVGVVYLSRKLRRRSAHTATRRVTRQEAVSAG